MQRGNERNEKRDSERKIELSKSGAVRQACVRVVRRSAEVGVLERGKEIEERRHHEDATW